MRAIVFVGLMGVLTIGCTPLECDPEAMEVDGACECRPGYMPFEDRCVFIEDTGMNDAGPDGGADANCFWA